MKRQHKDLVSIIRNATALIDYDLSEEQLDDLTVVLDTLDRLIVSAYEEANP